MKSSNKKITIRIYRNSTGYSYYDSSASSLSANLRDSNDLFLNAYNSKRNLWYKS